MKWVRFRHDGADVFGCIDGSEVVLHTGSLFDQPRASSTRVSLACITDWLTPCAPRTMVGLWNNFAALAAKNGWARPAEPLYFLKAPGSFAAHRQAIRQPVPDVGRIAYEGELAVVIGRTARAVSVPSAPAHIFGYTCANDVTALEVFDRDPAFVHWTRAKGFDTFGVFGPVIETDFDFRAATLRTRVAGRERQNYALADMLFSPAELVSRISHDITLQPGDVILCGTSLGVLPMKPGTLVEVEIDGIGVLANVYG